MIIQCKSCEKKFSVPDNAIPVSGRLVQCSSCGEKWTQFPVIKKKNETFEKINKLPQKPKSDKERTIYPAAVVDRRFFCRYMRGETPVILLKTRLKCCTVAKPVSRAMRAISNSVSLSNWVAFCSRQVLSHWRKDCPVVV